MKCVNMHLISYKNINHPISINIMDVHCEISRNFKCKDYRSGINNVKNFRYCKIVKAIYDKPTTNIILNGKKLKAFSLKSGRDKGANSHHYYST